MLQKTSNHFLKFSIHLSVRKSWENYRQIYGKSKESLWRNLSTGRPPIFFQDNPLLCSLSLQLIFFSEQPFYGNYSTLHSHTNTVISHTFAQLVKMASKTMTRSILAGLKKIVRYTEAFFIQRFVKSRFHLPQKLWHQVTIRC